MHRSDLRGMTQLVVDATHGINGVVRDMHHTILRLPRPWGADGANPPRGVHGAVYKVLHGSSSLVYRGVRGVTSVVGAGLERAWDHLPLPLKPQSETPAQAAWRSVLNGVLGDHLTERGNPLGLEMGFYQGGHAVPLAPERLRLAFPAAQGRIVLMLHGHCMNELQWERAGHHHGRVLEQMGNCTVLYLRYNTGRHISHNGRALAAVLQQLQSAWPVPVQRIDMVGFSMGGLLARSAVHHAVQEDLAWVKQLYTMVFVGTPHHGSMVERWGNRIDRLLRASPYSAVLARLGQVRSAGTTDLRHGNLLDSDWNHADRFSHGTDARTPVPLPAGVQCYAIAAVLSHRMGGVRDHWVGDGLVPLPSALGQHTDARFSLGLSAAHTRVLPGTSHLGLLNHPEVAAALREWLAAR